LTLLAAAIVTIAATGGAWAHGDPASHYLETDELYPSFARQSSIEAQLQLLGLLQATEQRGYPIKVAIVAGAEDLVDDLALMRTPQRYANTVASTLDRDLEAPILVVTPFGIGVSGNSLRHGVLRPVTTSRDARRLVGRLEVPPDSEGDDLARTAMAAVRRIARAAGKPLPARVPPVQQVRPAEVPAPPGEHAAVAQDGGGGSGPLWVVPTLAVPFALLFGYRRSRRSPAVTGA
jgi:hypothetical protein